MKKLFLTFLSLHLVLLLSGCGSQAMSVSVSTDGQYAVSAHQNNSLYLWNIDDQRKKRIARDANIYSAYFVRGRDVFIWQDLENQIHVHSVDAGELLTFEYPEPVYGHLMTGDLQRYLASDIGFRVELFDLEGSTTHTLKNADGRAFLGFGKVLNMNLSADEKYLLTAGYSYSFPAEFRKPRPTLEEEAERNHYAEINGVTLWSLETLEPVARLYGNSSKTHASISPDGQWVISGDENGLGRLWNTGNPEERFTNSSYYHGLYRGQDEEGNTNPRDFSGFIPPPSKRINSSTLATLFIKNSHYYVHLSYTGPKESHPYAALFETGNPWPIKYFDLGTDPWPSTREYSRNLTVSTAPEAGILVTGQHSRGGINVYQFDAEALTLERIWIGR